MVWTQNSSIKIPCQVSKKAVQCYHIKFVKIDEQSDSKKTNRWAADRMKSKRPLQSTNESCDHEATISTSTSVEVAPLASKAAVEVEDCGRKRLKEHRVEMAGRVWIPDIWGKEDFLKDWVDCNPFDASLVNNNILSARQALIQGQTSS
ncbi:hypothetical protein POM88_004331 [Heracleum sosnowskyi]|uniref:Protein BIC1-like n=1 Tax=Heracleum sosnowskyi TaxID=360622 RepID=A0AAD8JL86_9APIA|nr:hypothetical protein POM88_004331 [Heracleum sosnowskyi]